VAVTPNANNPQCKQQQSDFIFKGNRKGQDWHREKQAWRHPRHAHDIPLKTFITPSFCDDFTRAVLGVGLRGHAHDTRLARADSAAQGEAAKGAAREARSAAGRPQGPKGPEL
jgi:hypothetical protein